MVNRALKIILFFLLLMPAMADARNKTGAEASTLSALIGVDVSGLESIPPGVPCPATTGIDPECQYYHSKNLNILRVAFSWEQMQPTLGGALNLVYLGYIQNIVRQAGLLNMKVILDCHNFGAYNGISIGASNGPTYAQFANLWSQIAVAVHGQTGLAGYDMMNEPHDMPTATTVPEMYQAAITAIRSVDTTSTIYAEGNAYATAYGWLNNLTSPLACGWGSASPVNNGGNNNLLALTDPNDNLVFEAHEYSDYNGSGTYPVAGQSVSTSCTTTGASPCTVGQDTWQCAQTMGEQLTNPVSALTTNVLANREVPFVTWCNQNHKKCWLGESGVTADDPNWLTTLNNGIAYALSNNVQFTYWSAGPYSGCFSSTNCSYPLGAYPYGLYLTPFNPIDTVQMAVLTQYSNAYLPTTYQITGPQRGTVATPSNFSVIYHGLVRKSFTVTPNDGGAGGTFTPSSVTCSTGYNCLQTFTYTAPGTAVYAIGSTNTGNLTDPSALGYATVADQFSSSGLSTVNAFAMRKIFAPYIGNAITLRRASDGAISSFGFTGLALNSPLNTAAIKAWNGTSETDTLSSTQIIVQYAPQFWSDGGVVNTATSAALTKISCLYGILPTAGQYCVSGGGHYTFSTADLGNTLKISYIFPTYVVSWLDQSLNNRNAGVVTPDGGIPVVSLSNQPGFLLTCQNSQPCIYFNGTNYMDILSPLGANGTQTQQSVLGVFSPTQNSGALVEWAWSGVNLQSFFCNTATSCSGNWENSYDNQINSDTNPARTYSVDGQWHASATTYASGGSDGDRTFFDGQITDRTPASNQVYSLPYGRTNATMGYSRFFSPPATYTGYVGEIVIGNNALSNSSVVSFQNDENNAWNIPTYSGYTFFTSTNNQNPTNANSLPWWGVNEEGLEFGNTVVRPAAATYYATRGMNIVRVPTKWETWQPTLGGALSSAYLTVNQQNISTFNSNGIDVIIDNHSGPAYNGCTINGAGCPTTAQFAAFWAEIATAFPTSTYPKVYFDLANEPAAFGSDYTGWAAVVQAAINAIRGTGNTSAIFVEMNNGFASCNGGGSGGVATAFLSLTDTANNLVYECHNYFDSNNGGYLPTAAYAIQNSATNDLSGITTWAQANNVKLFFGEHGPSFTSSMTAEMKVAYDLIAANLSNGTNGGWLGATAWGGGQTPGVWGNGYFFVMEPAIFDSNPVTDRPLMRFLNTYWTQHTWPCSIYASGSSGPCSSVAWPAAKFP